MKKRIDNIPFFNHLKSGGHQHILNLHRISTKATIRLQLVKLWCPKIYGQWIAGERDIKFNY